MMDQDCLYCENLIGIEDYLVCLTCRQNVHIKCLKRPGTPGDLVGDIFFEFKCTNCTLDRKEYFLRKKLPWSLIIVLTLYNLSVQSKGLSHYGYFHWRTHIANFITKNWINLFPPNFKPKKKWIGTISGTLSHNNPEFFVSGFDFINESGWWKLTYNQTPKFYLNLYESLQQKRAAKHDKVDKNEDINVVDVFGSDNDENLVKKFKPDVEIFSRTLPYMGRVPRTIPPTHSSSSSQKNISSEYDTESIQSNLTDFLANELSNSAFLDELTNLNSVVPNNFLLNDDSDNPETGSYDTFSWNYINEDNIDNSAIISPTIPKLENSIFDYTLPMTANGETNGCLIDIKQEKKDLDYQHLNYQPRETMGSVENVPRIIQVTNYQEADLGGANMMINEMTKILKQEHFSEDEHDENEDTESVGEETNEEVNIKKEETTEKIVCEKSLFTKNEPREYPWLNEYKLHKNLVDEDAEDCGCSVEMISVYEENILCRKLKVLIDNEQQSKLTVPPWVRRFYRKLALRHYKRENSKFIHNFDSEFVPSVKQMKMEVKLSQKNILDRYYYLTSDNRSKLSESSFHARLAGTIQHDRFISPYTGRILHPFIYKNTKCIPSWIKLMCEVQYYVTEELPERAPIDFCYVQAQHIPAVNGLLQRTFWAGIDMSDSLSYPDFSCIALYKKLVVGCAFLVPDVGDNEAYVSFMAVRPGWQRCGIAKFMLYHLTQTCMSKDITLHVSATNPAICLYQKFGFKIEEIVLDFYEKYLPIDSKDSRHALLLRMKR